MIGRKLVPATNGGGAGRGLGDRTVSPDQTPTVRTIIVQPQPLTRLVLKPPHRGVERQVMQVLRCSGRIGTSIMENRANISSMAVVHLVRKSGVDFSTIDPCDVF